MSKKNEVVDIFEIDSYVQTNYSEWNDMPEFVNEQKKPYHLLTVYFGSDEHYEEFSEKIEQKLTHKTKSIWHPKLDHFRNSNLRYVDSDSIDG